MTDPFTIRGQVVAISFYAVRAGICEAEVDYRHAKEGKIIQLSGIDKFIKEHEPCLVWIHGRIYERGDPWYFGREEKK